MKIERSLVFSVMNKIEVSKKTRIAIVDDSALVRLCMSMKLTQMGFNVLFEAEDGNDLLKKLRTAVVMPEVCIMDVEMPNLNGIDATEIVKKEWPHIAVLAHSSATDRATVISMLKNGADAFICKDLECNVVRRAIQNLSEHAAYFDSSVFKTIQEYFRTVSTS